MLNYLILILFGLAPSIIWLLFFLRKDSHPESNSMVLKIFFFGMLAAIPAALLELGFYDIIKNLPLPSYLIHFLYVFVGIAFIEEIFKYLVVKKQVLRDPECDEPVDIMLYMIIAALGFAALENVLVFLPLNNGFQLLETAIVGMFRFVGATFLHALGSGLIGYYLALSFLQAKNRFKVVAKGIILATLLHGLYDFSIINIEGALKFVIPVIILTGLAIFISLGFKKVKKLKSVCLPRRQAGKPKKI
ncbi:MAG: PrsW family glutamic-type intramembrane protease [Candidatus Nealsonbacteria bacterium]|nr:PrsW family glutamic-type intramembrane protease [Candidatus Nealsonbacteria bacterium]